MSLEKPACGALTLALALSAGAANAKPPIITFNGGGTPTAFAVLSQDLTDYTKTPDTFFYAATGSSAGQSAFLTDNIGYFKPQSSTNPSGYAAGTRTYGTVSGTAVDFALTDAPLTSSQISNYSRSSTDGPLIQFPVLGVPVALAYNASSSALTLTDAQICGVLSGQITDFHALDPAVASGTAITVVVPSDGSVTTYLLTQHLNAVCTSGNSSFPEYPVPVTQYFYNSAGATAPVFPNGLPPDFDGVTGSAAIAAMLGSTANSFGYLPPDYTSIAPNATNTTSLPVAWVVNGQNGVGYLPTVANTTLAMNNPGPGATDVTPPASMALAENQMNWAPTMPQPALGYSIIGFPMAIMSSCYDVVSAQHLIGAIRNLLSKKPPYATNATHAGYVPMQTAKFGGVYATAINRIFLTDKDGYGLNINEDVPCSSYTGR
jgi:phosphate transport system substrate-binding protein